MKDGVILRNQIVSGSSGERLDGEAKFAEDNIAGLCHQIFAKCAGTVGQALIMASAGGVEEQTRSFESVPADDDSASALQVLIAFGVEVDDAIRTPALSMEMLATMELSRISAPWAMASGTCVTRVEAFAPTLQP